jgi:hypothetical protein
VIKSPAAGTTKMTFEVMMEAIRDSVDDVTTSDEEDDHYDNISDGQDYDDAKLSDDDAPGWVVGTINKSVQERLETVPMKRIKLQELTTLAWAEAEADFTIRNRKYGTTKLKILTVVTLNTTINTANTSIFGHFRDALNRVPVTKSPMAQPPSSPIGSHL